MDTLIRIYLFFIGVIAVLICFLTWMSIRLRAERINKIRIEKERHNDFNKIFNLEYELNSVKKTNQQIIDSKNVTIDKLTDYANILFKDLKGALEMNAKLMEATKGLEQTEQPTHPEHQQFNKK